MEVKSNVYTTKHFCTLLKFTDNFALLQWWVVLFACYHNVKFFTCRLGSPIATLLLQWERLTGKCAKLRTVAASNNRVHLTRSLFSSPLASIINCSQGWQALLEVTHQDHPIGIILLLLVRTTHVWCYSRTFHSWWITQSTQHNQRGCNNILSFLNEPRRLHVLVKSARSTTFTSSSQHHFVAIRKPERPSAQSFTLWQQATIEFTRLDHFCCHH